MAPVPTRGKRNESAFVNYVLECIAQCYNVEKEYVAQVTTATAERIFRV